MNYNEEVPKLVSKFKITKKSAAEIMGIRMNTYYIKESERDYNRFTKENYEKLKKHLGSLKV